MRSARVDRSVHCDIDLNVHVPEVCTDHGNKYLPMPMKYLPRVTQQDRASASGGSLRPKLWVSQFCAKSHVRSS